MIDYATVPSPAFVLDLKRLKRNLELIQGVQERAGVEVVLALKGFSMWRVFPLIGEYLAGGTASGPHEARLIFEEMGKKAHTYSAAYLPSQFEETLRYSSHISFNSLAEFNRYKAQVQAWGEPVSMGLRLNPEYSEVEVDLYNPSSPESRLGILQDRLEHLDRLPEGIEGLHVHTLCESSARATGNLIEALEARFGRFLPQCRWVNLGGGHLMTRSDYELNHLIDVLTRFRKRHPHLELILEPGSAIAWETGELVSTVLDIVETRRECTAIVDVSFTAHMPDTLEMPYRPRILGATDPVAGKPSYRIGGVSCLAGDYISAYSFDRELQAGDRLVFWDMMHYTMVKTTTFNGVQHPHLCLWDGQELELVKAYGYADFKGRLS